MLDIQLDIILSRLDLLFFSRPHRPALDWLKAKAEFGHILRTSAWESPLHLIRKGEVDFRSVGVYCRLNTVTTADRYTIPNLQDFNANLHGCHEFSKVDLIRAYHQIPMNSDDIPKTAVCTPFDSSEFLSMSFGIRNATNTFKRFINEMVHGLDWFVDDLLISDTEGTHFQYLTQLFDKVNSYNVCINPEKFVSGQFSFEFLGHLIDANSIHTFSSKINAIQRTAPQKSLRQLRHFIGIVNFYRRSISNCADKMLLLTQFLK